MGFRFSLETVLRLRRSLERKQELHLQMLLARQAAIESSLQSTANTRIALKRELTHAAGKLTLPAAEIRFVHQRLGSCELATARLEDELATARKQVNEDTAVLIEQSRRRKLLECLKQQQERRYAAEAERRTQAEVEQMHLMLRAASAAQQAGQLSHDAGS